jgi:hypothetical protein
MILSLLPLIFILVFVTILSSLGLLFCGSVKPQKIESIDFDWKKEGF